MKKFLRGAMAVGLAASMTACASQQAPESTTAAATEAATTAAATEAANAGSFVAGTYSGSEQGFGGKVTVTVTTTDTEITDVQIEGKDETPTVGGAALEELASQIKEKQSAEIDGVSGATLTSNGVKDAVKAALAK